MQLHVTNLLDPSLFPLPGSPFEQLFHAPFELFVLFDQLLDPADQVLRLRLQRARRLFQLPFELADQRVRPGPGHRLDAAHPRRRAGLVREAEQRDLPGARHVSPAAQLERDARHVHHAHDGTVFLGEERHGAGGDRVLVFHLARPVTIQYCESYNNNTKTSTDGGGFDFDWDVTNSTIQYCYSHNNAGPGYIMAAGTHT